MFVFGDATHVYSASKVARDEFGFDVVGLGTYSREFAREIRELGKEFGLEAIISDDYVAVEKAIVELQPELILGTQMERHIAKKHNIPSALFQPQCTYKISLVVTLRKWVLKVRMYYLTHGFTR